MFSTKVLAQQEFNTANILEYSNVEESFFINSLEFVKESMTEYRDANKRLYKNILESQGNEEVINESFSDFFESVKKIIDKFIKYIKSLFERFVVALNKFISSDKYIVKNKEKLSKFTDEHKFSIEGFNYSLSAAIPLINAQAKFEESFIKLDFEELQGEVDQKVILSKVKKKYSDLMDDINGEWYNAFRGEVIGKGSIDQSDYADELFKVYRDGASSKESIDITGSYITAALLRFENHKKTESDIKKTRDQIEKDYENIKKQVQGIVKQNGTKDINKLVSMTIHSDYDKVGTGSLSVSTEVMNQIDLFVKKKVEQIMEMSSIHSLAFSYKLDAVKDCYKQDKAVLYKSLSQVAKDINI